MITTEVAEVILKNFPELKPYEMFMDSEVFPVTLNTIINDIMLKVDYDDMRELLKDFINALRDDRNIGQLKFIDTSDVDKSRDTYKEIVDYYEIPFMIERILGACANSLFTNGTNKLVLDSLIKDFEIYADVKVAYAITGRESKFAYFGNLGIDDNIFINWKQYTK